MNYDRIFQAPKIWEKCMVSILPGKQVALNLISINLKPLKPAILSLPKKMVLSYVFQVSQIQSLDFYDPSFKSWTSPPVRRLGSRTSFLCCCASNINLFPKNTPPATANVKDQCRGSKKTCCPSIWGAVMIPGTLQNDGPITSNHPQTSIFKKRLPFFDPPASPLQCCALKKMHRSEVCCQQHSRWVNLHDFHLLGQSFRNIPKIGDKTVVNTTMVENKNLP